MYDLIVIGAGPGGMDTAVAATKKYEKILLIEKDQIGGTCLNRGCIPTKSIAQSARILHDIRRASIFGIECDKFFPSLERIIERKNQVVNELRNNTSTLLKQIEFIKGEAKISTHGTVVVDGEEYNTRRILIATGSQPAMLNIPGREFALTSDQLLENKHLPEDMIIIGGGVIGLEFASIFNTLGVQVTVVEYCKEILPTFDRDIAKRLRMALTKKGIKFITDARVTEIIDKTTVEFEKKDKCETVEAEMIIMAVGRKPVFPDGLESIGVEFSHKGIQTDDNQETNVKGVYAIGDVTGKCMLAHFATAQGKRMLGENINLEVVPSVVFCEPECSMVGLTEEQCHERGIQYTIKKGFFRANGKAVCMDETEGMVKMIIGLNDMKVLGVHIYGPHAADLIAEPAIAISQGLTVSEIAETIHAHPTLNEIISQIANG